MTDLALIAGGCSRRFAAAVAEQIGVPLLHADSVRFSDGNTFVRILENVRGRHVCIIQSVAYPVNDSFMELLFWIDAARRASASEVTAVIPYFGYAKGDKKDEPRVSIRARVCADCLEAAGASRVLFMDPHAPQIQGFFRLPVDHLYALGPQCEDMRQLGLRQPLLVACDAGFAKNAIRYAEHLGWPLVIGEKRRDGHEERIASVQLFGPEVDGMDAVLIDDFTVSGGTLMAVTAELRRRGAASVRAYVSHAPFAPGAAALLDAADLEEIIATDTVEEPEGHAPQRLRRVSVAPLFARAIEAIYHKRSISTLFAATGLDSQD
ncbi:MAG: ribose-phosphate diphosphokinase [Dehalococcoidia bacterium]